jgi:glyoxylase-like metal-dependent hydrolase (beta-lactamase superfamily II)/rhodanese-related sulfurtransferase
VEPPWLEDGQAGRLIGHLELNVPGMLIFRQLFDAASSTYTYLLGDSASGEAVLIDPVFENERRDLALLRELGLRLVATLDTHVHADHVTAAWLLKQRCGSQILLSENAGAANADRLLKHGDKVGFGSRHLAVRATPGHTSGCLSYVLDDHSMAFTGDSLLIRGCGRTDFQQGSPAKLFRSVKEQILSLPAACLLYPAHDYRGLTVTSVGEERRFNPRLGGDVDASDFAGYMNNLGLPHPKLMDIAVPANLRCGQPDAMSTLSVEPGWAPLTCNFAGVWEIQPTALQERIAGSGSDDTQVIDVREPAEFTDVLGHIHGARLLPLSQLAARTVEIERDRPVVTVCRSGARSAQATVLLQKAGYTQVANLAGGMLRWRAEALPVEAGAD